MSKRNPSALGVWGNEGTRVVAAESAWKEVLKWNHKAGEAGERHRVFCASMADVFEDWQGPMSNAVGSVIHGDQAEEWGGVSGPITMQSVRNRLFELIDRTPNLDWLLLTKRPENVLHMMPPSVTNVAVALKLKENGNWKGEYYRENVWFGTSVENQEQKKRIDILRQVPARIRFLSIEPLLEDLGELNLNGIHWVIVGGESGHKARPMHPGWVRFIRDQCQAAEVPFFFKQWGEWAPEDAIDQCGKAEHGWWEDSPEDGGVHEHEWQDSQFPCRRTVVHRVGKKAAGRILDGRTWDEVPGIEAI